MTDLESNQKNEKEYRFSCNLVPESESFINHSGKMQVGQLWRQYIIAGVASIAISATGFILGWTSPISYNLVTGKGSPLDRPVTGEELSWIGSLLTIGAFFGPLVAGVLVAKIGRKKGLLMVTVPFVSGWILIRFHTLVSIYIARILLGLGVGMVYTILPMYNAEIATDDKRGALGCFIQLFVTFGFLLVYVVGPLSTYNTVASVGLGLVLLFSCLFSFMPESPFYHLSKGNREAAADCLSKIRGQSHADVQAELDKMSRDVAASLKNKGKLSDLFKRDNMKTLGIAIIMISIQQFCGINAVLFYMPIIFAASGSSLSPAAATILVGSIQCLSSFVTPFVADKVGRRVLLLVSCFFTAFSLGLLGLYYYLDHHNYSFTRSIDFVPVLSLIIFIVAFCNGLGPVPFTLLGELFAMEVRASASTVGTLFVWITCFIVTRFFEPINEALGMFAVFWMFSGFCIIGFLFTLFFVPETKGKSFQEIQDMMKGR